MLDDVKAKIKTANSILILDERLVSAVFEPAVKDNVWMLTDLPWKNPDNKDRADSLIEQLLPLSEYYQSSNPSLSAAIWGIWNSVYYFRRQRSIFSILFEGKKKREKLFIDIRGLVATAAIQFCDSTATTVVTSNAMKNFSEYERVAEAAIQKLTSFKNGL